jgi:hypothetical protein
MYKVTFEVNHGVLNIIQISKQDKDNWALVKNPEILAKVEEKFIRTRSSFYSGAGYGEVIYTENLTYVKGSFDRIK